MGEVKRRSLFSALLRRVGAWVGWAAGWSHRMAPLRVRPLITRTAGLDFGAEVRPQSLPLPPDELAAVAAALEAHGVVVLRLPTPLSDEEHVAFGEGLAATLGSRLESDADGPRRSVVTNIGDGGTILPASHPTLSAIVGAQFWCATAPPPPRPPPRSAENNLSKRAGRWGQA